MFGREVVSVVSWYCIDMVSWLFLPHVLCKYSSVIHKNSDIHASFQDNSDAQYRSFRNNIPSLSALVLIFIALKYLYARSASRSVSSTPLEKLYLIPFYLMFTALYLIGLHGTSILKIIVILSANYWIAKVSGGSRTGPLLTWIFNGSILFANEIYGGYRYANFHPSLEVLVRSCER